MTVPQRPVSRIRTAEPVTASPELSTELLAKPAPHAVRLIAVARLADVTAKYERLWAGDEEELHDLRVALRRLRSWLRAYRPELDDTLRRKTRRRLSKLASDTNGARDAEVALEWIGSQTGLTRRELAGTRYICARLQRELDAARKTVRETLEGDLPKLLTALSDQLGIYWQRQSLDDTSSPDDMAAATREVLERHAERFDQAIDRIDSATDFDAAHRARIAAKRLRYLLETLNGDPDAAALVARLTSLQEILGVVHDSHRIVNRLVRELGECAARDARRSALHLMELGDEDDDEMPAFAKIRPGLLALVQRAHASERKGYGVFKRRWRKRQVQKTLADVTIIAKSL